MVTYIRVPAAYSSGVKDAVADGSAYGGWVDKPPVNQGEASDGCEAGALILLAKSKAITLNIVDTNIISAICRIRRCWMVLEVREARPLGLV